MSMYAGKEIEARELMLKADKKMKGFKLFGSKEEGAEPLYEKAGNFFKLAQSCTFARMSRCRGRAERIIRHASGWWRGGRWGGCRERVRRCVHEVRTVPAGAGQQDGGGDAVRRRRALV